MGVRMGVRIDLNADLGEGFGAWQLGDDAALLEVITSANVACGFHAGDPRIMARVCAGAVEHGVAIGAQVGYRDLAGFGRRRMDVDPADLAADVAVPARRAGGVRPRRRQPGALREAARRAVQHRRRRPGQAGAVAAAVADYDRSLPVLGLPGSALGRCGRGRRAVRRRGLRRPRLHRRRPARAAQRAGRGAPRRGHRRRAGGARAGRGRHAPVRRRCACTATRRAPSASPAPCVPPSRHRAPSWPRSRERRQRGRRTASAPCWSRRTTRTTCPCSVPRRHRRRRPRRRRRRADRPGGVRPGADLRPARA